MRRLPAIAVLLAPFLVAVAVAAADPAPEAPPQPPAPEEPTQVWLGVLLGNAVDGGAQVVALVPQGPAAMGGILEGDVILSIDGDATPDREALSRVLARLTPGKTARVTILRGGESVTRSVAVARRSAPVAMPLKRRFTPEAAEAWAVSGWTGGMGVTPIPRELRMHYGAPAGAGVLVTSVDPGGAAAAAKVQVGDVLVSIDGSPCLEATDLPRAFLSRPDLASISLALIRDRKPVTARMAVAMQMQHEEQMEVSEAPEGMAIYRSLGSGGGPDSERIQALELEIERLTKRLAAVEEELTRVKKEP